MIANPLQINDWKIKKFLRVVIAIQLAIWGVVGLDALDFQIPILRQLIGFIYLTSIPGIIIIRILKLHTLGDIETLTYTVGLSIATLMFIGLFMNTVYPFFGISKPISIAPLIITISAVVLVLCVLCYMRDKDFSDPSFIGVREVLSPPVLFLCLFPFLSIFGAYLINFHHNNVLLMAMIVVISITTILIVFGTFIPKNLYPFAVFIIAISLLYHNSLISMYLWGWDIQFEYYLSNLVTINTQWDSTIPINTNAMLSIVMLAPIFSNICGMSLTWIFKIIYPLVFALVPLGLYRVFQKQTNDKIAFLSCFFFMSLFVFYTEMLALARQQIAELFLVLLMLLMIDKNMDRVKRAGLITIFAFSITVSHYGLSYIFMFSLIAVYGLLFLNARRKNQNKVAEIVTTPRFVALYITFTIAWYMYVSSSSAFETIVSIGDHIASSIFTDFLNPEAAEGIDLITRRTVSPLHDVLKYLHLIAQFFIAIGVFTLLVKREGMKFEEEYAAFSYVNFMICFAGIMVPHFASSLNTTRLYHITLIFLAPFCVIGGVAFCRMLNHAVRKPWTDRIDRSSLRILSVFFVIFLLFNSGWVFEVARDKPTSISLNSTIDYPRFNEQEMSTGHWLKDKKTEHTKIYSDDYRGLMLLGIFGKRYIFSGDKEITTWIPPNNVYIFLGHENVKNNEIIILNTPRGREWATLQNLTFYNTLLNMSKIYSNNNAQVYYR